MEELQINWQQEKPGQSELIKLWNSMQLQRLEDWTSATQTFKEKILETHCNGGIQLHRYKIKENKYFEWFAQRNRLDEIGFLKNIFRCNDLADYRADLNIEDSKPEVKQVKYSTDIYELTGRLARILGWGGAYNKIDPSDAWRIANAFVESEFENRFQEINYFEFTIGTANWFYDIAWDTSILLFDKRKYEIIIIDITDTD